MAQSSISPAMLQRWIAKQQMMQQIASMGGMPSVPSGIDGASQMMPGAPNVASLSPSLMDMMGGSQAPQQAPQGLLETLGAPPIAFDGRQLQSLAPPPMAMMASQAPTPAGVPSFRRPPQPAMASKALQEQRRAQPATPYLVVKGDNLTKIAKRLGTTVKALLAKNPEIKNANRIQIGQRLKV